MLTISPAAILMSGSRGTRIGGRPQHWRAKRDVNRLLSQRCAVC